MCHKRDNVQFCSMLHVCTSPSDEMSIAFAQGTYRKVYTDLDFHAELDLRDSPGMRRQSKERRTNRPSIMCSDPTWKCI